MALLVEAQKLLRSIAGLGPRRLWQLAAVGATTLAAVGVASFLASRPTFEVLYSGLDPQDLARVTSLLRETSVPFDISADGGTLLVEYGHASRARMLLADKGLP